MLLQTKFFFEARQMSRDTATEFAVRLRRIGTECDFGTGQQEMLRVSFFTSLKTGCDHGCDSLDFRVGVKENGGFRGGL